MTSRRKAKLYNYGSLLRSIHKGLNDVKHGRLFVWVVDEVNDFRPPVKNTRAHRRRAGG